MALSFSPSTMVIIHWNVDPKVLDGMGFHQCKAECVAKEELTYEKLKGDLDTDHLEGAAITNIARFLTKFIPELARFASDVNDLQYKKYAKHHIKLERTEYHPLQCMSYNEAYTQGNCDAILDVFINQLGDQLQGVRRKDFYGIW